MIRYVVSVEPAIIESKVAEPRQQRGVVKQWRGIVWEVDGNRWTIVTEVCCRHRRTARRLAIEDWQNRTGLKRYLGIFNT